MGRRRFGTPGLLAIALGAAIAPGIATGATANPAAAPTCDLVRHKQAEFGSCVLVTAEIQKAPKVWETGTVTLKLKAASGISGSAKVRIETTPNIALKTLPSGFKAASAMTKTLGTVGQRATSTIKLSSGATSTRTITFTPTKAGYGSVRVIADSPVDVPGARGGSADAVFLTFDSKSGAIGLPAKLDDSSRTLPAATKVTSPSHAKLNKEAPALSKEELRIDQLIAEGGGQQDPPKQLKRIASRRATAAASACVTGRLAVPDMTVESGDAVAVSAANVPVSAWDTRFGGDAPLARGRTEADGRFRLCFDNAETDGWPIGSGTADVYVKWTLDTGNFMVGSRQMFGDVEMDVGNTWEWRTPTAENVPGGTRDLGILTASDPLQAGAIAAFQIANMAWERIPRPCWDQVGSCDRKKIAWSPDSRTWPHYSLFPYAVIQLPWEAPLDVHTTAHEIGHALAADVFDYSTDDMLRIGCPNPHTPWSIESPECAFSEGFATWFASHVMGVPTAGGFNYGSFIRPVDDDLERATWTIYEWAKGDIAEMRVATALWDIEDGLGSPTSDPYDRLAGGFDRIWAAFQAGKSLTFREFIERLEDTPGRYLGVDLTSTLYGSTIDRGNPFREDLFVNRVRSFGEGDPATGAGWGGPHVVAPNPGIGVTSGHRYRLVRPLASPSRTRDYVLAVRSKGASWTGPIAVNATPSETPREPISGQGTTRYAWNWAKWDERSGSLLPIEPWTTAATVIRNSSMTSEYAYAILPYSGSSSASSRDPRPGYDVEMTEAVPLSVGGANVRTIFPRDAIARAYSFPVAAGVKLAVELNTGCLLPSGESSPYAYRLALTMMNASSSAVRTSNRMGGWRLKGSPTSSPALTIGAPVDRRWAGVFSTVVFFRPALTTTAILLLSQSRTTPTAKDMCLDVKVREPYLGE